MKKCPSCGSTRYKENAFTGTKHCQKCGYLNKKSRYKEIVSKTGTAKAKNTDNAWMNFLGSKTS